jgi:hypothetical protein
VDLRVDAEVSCHEPPFCDVTVTDSDSVQRSDVASVDESIDARASIPDPFLGATGLASLQTNVTGDSITAGGYASGGLFEPGPGMGGLGSGNVSYLVTFQVGSLVCASLATTARDISGSVAPMPTQGGPSASTASTSWTAESGGC